MIGSARSADSDVIVRTFSCAVSEIETRIET